MVGAQDGSREPALLPAHVGTACGTPATVPQQLLSTAPPSPAKKLPVLTSRGGQMSSTKPGQVLSAARFYCAYQHVWNGGNHFYMLKNSDSFFLPKPTT